MKCSARTLGLYFACHTHPPRQRQRRAALTPPIAGADRRWYTVPESTGVVRDSLPLQSSASVCRGGRRAADGAPLTEVCDGERAQVAVGDASARDGLLGAAPVGVVAAQHAVRLPRRHPVQRHRTIPDPGHGHGHVLRTRRHCRPERTPVLRIELTFSAGTDWWARLVQRR